MADQNPQHGRRQHFHRGRRGQDRRGSERRGPAPAQPAEQSGREHVDVEQIMREIRSRISQRHGIELTTQQIQELAARRLEAILDPRTVKPSLLEQIRRSTSTPLDTASTAEPAYNFEETTIYDSHRGSLRFIRRLLNPLLKLFFNPDPLIAALNAQAKLNQAAALREAERERRQAEWNALHYDILQRLVLEVSRASLEAQQLSMRVEALSAKVDFAERRARSIEGTLHQARPSPRHETSPPMAQIAQQPRESGSAEPPTAATPQEGGTGTGEGRRRRRRRRGRRPQGFTPEGAAMSAVAGAVVADARMPEGGEPPDVDDMDDDDGEPDIGDEAEAVEAAAPVETGPPVEAAPVPLEAAPVPLETVPVQQDEEPVSRPVDALPAQEPPLLSPPAPPSGTPPETEAESAPAEFPDRPRPTEPFGD